MRIKKHLGFGGLLIILLAYSVPYRVSAETVGNLEVVGNQTWSGASYEINGNVHVNSGARLYISPQSNILILPTGKFNVNGELRIAGSLGKTLYAQTLTGNKNNPVFNLSQGLMTIENREIETDRPFINAFASSTIIFDNSSIKCENPSAVFGNVFHSSKIAFLNSKIDHPHCKNILNVFDGTSALVASSTVDGFEGEAFVKAFGNSVQPISSVELRGGNFIGTSTTDASPDNRAAFIFSNAEIFVKDSKFTNFTKAIELSSNSHGTVDFSEFDKNFTPFYVRSATLDINNSALTNSTGLTVDSVGATSSADHNWWGTTEGPIKISDWNGVDPFHQKVTDEVVFNPWLLENPKKPKVTCCSNILFIPGVEGSRLYKKSQNGREDELWVPSTEYDVRDLSMDNHGNSLDPNIYTKDIIDVAASFLGWQSSMKPYADFMKQLQNWQTKGDIKDYFNFAYDWRLRPQEIVEQGALYPNNVQINPVGEILRLAKTSNTGKVTIITHSNGGLIAKMIVKKLIDMGRSDAVDKVVTVAMPEFGAPQAVASLLHGDGEAIGGGFVLSQNTARDFIQNVPTAYNLLPSPSYFSSNNNPTTSQNEIIQFKGASSPIKKWIKQFGDSVTSFSGLKNFLVGDKSTGVGSATSLDIPLKLNSELVDYAEASHSILDNFTFPINIPWFSIQAIGKATLSGLRYIDNLKCSSLAKSCSRIPDREAIVVSNGDGTVVTNSHLNNSSIPNITEVNILLDKSNIKNNTNLAHAELMRDKTTADVVSQIVHNSFDPQHPPELVNALTNNIAGSLHKFSVFSPATISVTDASGNVTGVSMDQAGEMHIVQNIPNSTFIDIGESKSVIVPNTSNYSVKIEGYDTGSFSFEDKTLLAGNNEGSLIDGEKVFFKDVPITDITTASYSTSEKNEIKIDSDSDGVMDSIETLATSSNPSDAKIRIKKIIDNMRDVIQKSSVTTNIKKRNLEKLDKIQKQILGVKSKIDWYNDKDLYKLLREIRGNYVGYMKKTTTKKLKLKDLEVDDSVERITDKDDEVDSAKNLKPLKSLYSSLYFYYSQIIRTIENLIDTN